MAKQIASFRKIDITRAILAAKAAGLAVGRVEIENGRIAIVSTSNAADTNSDLDVWMKKHAS